jgi:hypothetical protein
MPFRVLPYRLPGDATVYSSVKADSTGSFCASAEPSPNRAGPPAVILPRPDEDRGTRGLFHLSVGEDYWGRSGVRDFARRLEEWRRPADDFSREPVQCLPSPSLSPGLGQPLDAKMAARSLLTLLILRLLPAVLLCWLLGLRFDLVSGGATWYVLLAVGLGVVVDLLPYFRIRPAPVDPVRSD